MFSNIGSSRFSGGQNQQNSREAICQLLDASVAVYVGYKINSLCCKSLINEKNDQ